MLSNNWFQTWNPEVLNINKMIILREEKVIMEILKRDEIICIL